MSEYQQRGGSVPSWLGQAGEEAEQRLEQASETAQYAGRRARTLSHDLYRGAERARLLAAEGLSRAASTLRSSSAEPDSTARRFAGSLENSATYLRHTDLGGMQSDAVGLVRRYPGQALGAAFVVGLLVGQRLSRH